MSQNFGKEGLRGSVLTLVLMGGKYTLVLFCVFLLLKLHTGYKRSSDPFYIVNYYTKKNTIKIKISHKIIVFTKLYTKDSEP